MLKHLLRAKRKKPVRTLFGRAFYLAEWTGLEPATPGVTGRYSNQLNYHSNLASWLADVGRFRKPQCRQLNDTADVLASPRGFEPLYSP